MAMVTPKSKTPTFILTIALFVLFGLVTISFALPHPDPSPAAVITLETRQSGDIAVLRELLQNLRHQVNILLTDPG